MSHDRVGHVVAFRQVSQQLICQKQIPGCHYTKCHVQWGYKNEQRHHVLSGGDNLGRQVQR